MDEAEWLKIKYLTRKFGGVSEATIRRRVREMREVKQFKKYVVRPTDRETLIRYDQFIEFLRYKERMKFRGG